MAWYVLYVKPKREKAVAEKLTEIDIEAYCPLIKEMKQWSDRKKIVETPLFRSYVFVRIAEKNRNMVFKIPGVMRYLFWLGKPAIVKDDEIETIKDWLQDENIETLTLSPVSEGDRIVLKRGILKGQQATVQKVGKKDLRLIIDSLGVVVYAKKAI